MAIQSLVLPSSNCLTFFICALDSISDFWIKLIEEIVWSGGIFLLHCFGELNFMMPIDWLCSSLSTGSMFQVLARSLLFFESRSLPSIQELFLKRSHTSIFDTKWFWRTVIDILFRSLQLILHFFSSLKIGKLLLKFQWDMVSGYWFYCWEAWWSDGAYHLWTFNYFYRS